MKLNYENHEESRNEYITSIKEIQPLLNIEQISKAYTFAWKHHSNQKRKSGEPYICHPVAVSVICAEQNMDTSTVIAALLHDLIEDTEVTYDDVNENFGTIVAELVNGVTKISNLQMEDKESRKVETYRKILLTAAQDVRVIIIKFADRIHNLRTLDYMDEEKRKRIASETLKIYAPLANRLGMRVIKSELEDLAFKHKYPEDYNEILNIVSTGKHQRDDMIENFRVKLATELINNGIDAQVFGRSKHFYSIFKKNRERHVPYNEIFDLLAVRVICNTREECYQTLGIVHKLWTPIPDKLKDYIASPKSNGYQSIHTTVAEKGGHIIEVQIRTIEMNYLAEEGVAAHWRYKDKGDAKNLVDNNSIQWLRNLVDWQKEFSNSVEFYEFFKIDISHNEITIRTPKNQEITMPKGATALDFAFAIHSQLGIHCIGAKVNGNIEKPSFELREGDVVEILHSFDKKPSLKWLQNARTPKARSEIKRWFKKNEKEDRINIGRRLLYSSFKSLNIKKSLSDFMDDILNKLSIKNEEELYEMIGSAQIEVKEVINIVKKRHGIDPKASMNRIVNSIRGKSPKLHISTNENMMVRFATCCHPLPGDPIIGFLTSGRGISVHRKDCPNSKLFMGHEEKVVSLSWEDINEAELLSRVTVIASERKGLLKDIAELTEKWKINIKELTLKTSGQKVKFDFTVEVKSLKQLKKLKREISNLQSVTKVYRNQIDVENK